MNANPVTRSWANLAHWMNALMLVKMTMDASTLSMVPDQKRGNVTGSS